MKKIFVAILFSTFFAFPAAARIVNVSWANATTDTGGVALPTTGGGALATTRIEWSICTATGTFGTLAGNLMIPVTTPGGLQNSDTPNLGVGIYCFRAKHLTVDGTESNYSAVVSTTVTTGKPRPPQNVILT